MRLRKTRASPTPPPTIKVRRWPPGRAPAQGFLCLTALCGGEVEEYHPSQPRHGGRCSMTYILIVAGTALVLCAAALLIIERENAAT
jgi:hypothetical protein